MRSWLLFAINLWVFPACSNCTAQEKLQTDPAGINSVLKRTGSKQFIFILGIGNMHSTHGNNFPFLDIGIGKSVSNKFYAGIGLEYSGAKRHPDNGWDIRKLNLYPAYLDQQIYIFRGNFKPFFHFKEGVSFNTYQKSDRYPGTVFYQVKEWGLYLSGGMGASFFLISGFKFSAEANLKGYKISTNNLDINPHGITVGISLSYSVNKH